MRRVNLAYYKKEDWERFIKSIDDKESMHETWEEWYESFLKAKTQLILNGFSVFDFEVNIDQLNEFCKNRKIKNNGQARSQFVNQQYEH